ncbi:PREDICTED: mavicyanin-like [Ipomoea nil]|uniref:mavicyanin-like n=1 Tax=Ipomoea nil TaxID=35883 RepID=UPI000900F9AE|nr:PREDICTED: mavicyanin-like [Ipomoea nil]
MAVAVNFALLFLLLAAPVAFAADHLVGDSSGWTQSGDYTTWASSKKFAMGDNLVFNYGGSHGVDVVSKDDYDNCNGGNAIQSYTGGATTIKLSKSGPMYFICPTFGHCQTGMKLAINVDSGSSAAPAGSPPAGGTSPATPSPPSSGSESPPSTSTPSDRTTPTATSSPPNAAAGGSGCMSKVVVGVSIVVGVLFAFLG